MAIKHATIKAPGQRLFAGVDWNANHTGTATPEVHGNVAHSSVFITGPEVPANETDPVYGAWIAGPPNVSEFTNDAGYLIAEADPVFIAWDKDHADLSNVTANQHHAKQHAITAAADHTSAATPGQILKADANGLPIDATNTDAQVSGAVTASHARQHALNSAADHTGTITDAQHGVRTLANAHAHGHLSGIGANDHHAQAHTIVSHDTTATGAELDTLTDNSMADALHRHSELSASDGTPDRALVVDADGKVGIGTASPDYDLHIASASPWIQLEDTSPAQKFRIGITANALYFYDQTDARTNMVMNTSGNIGIGTPNPDHKLTIKSLDINTLHLLGPGDYDSEARLTFGDVDLVYIEEDEDDAMVINAALRIALMGGNVGIGTTSPTSKLQVIGLPIYANNAAALAGGLTAGAFYRTNADPDLVCVVH